MKFLGQSILKGTLITLTAPGQSSLCMHAKDDSLEVQIMKNTLNYPSTAEHGLYSVRLISCFFKVMITFLSGESSQGYANAVVV